MLGFGKCTRSLTSLGSIGSLGYVLGFKEFLGYDFLCKNIRNFFLTYFFNFTFEFEKCARLMQFPLTALGMRLLNAKLISLYLLHSIKDWGQLWTGTLNFSTKTARHSRVFPDCPFLWLCFNLMPMCIITSDMISFVTS